MDESVEEIRVDRGLEYLLSSLSLGVRDDREETTFALKKRGFVKLMEKERGHFSVGMPGV